MRSSDARAVRTRTLGWFSLGLITLGAWASCCPPALAQEEQEARRNDPAAADALFTNGAVHILKIQIPKEGLQSLRQAPRTYVKATLQEGSSRFTNVMVRLKGAAGSFRNVDDKPGLTVNLGEAGRTFHGVKKFHLNNSVQDHTYLSEWVCSDLFCRAGVPAARVAHAVVELNGRRLGLYALLESINSDFLARHFKKSHGNVYSLRDNADIGQRLERMGGREATTGLDLEALAVVARETDTERLQTQLPRVLDVDRFLSFMALEVMLDHWDGYTFNVKNYEVFHDLDTGRMVFMPHDLDQVLRNVSAPIMPQTRSLVSRAILRNPRTRAAYRARFEELATNLFVAPVLTRRIDQQAALLQAGLKNYDSRLALEVVNHAGSLKSRINSRAQSLAAQMKPQSLKAR
jgi:spore coat protein H